MHETYNESLVISNTALFLVANYFRLSFYYISFANATIAIAPKFVDHIFFK